MKKTLLIFIGVIFLLTGILNAKIVRSCDSFLFLVDESSSMKEVYKGKKKIEIEKKILKKINMNIPDISYTAGLRVFSYKKAYSTKSLYSVQAYNRDMMDKSIKKITAYREWTSIGNALDQSKSDLSKMKGKIHLVVFSDGNENSSYESPEKVALKLKNKFPNLCIFAVQIGKSKYGNKVLTSIVNASGCGKTYNAESLNYEINFNDFIKDVFGYEIVESKPVIKPVPVKEVKKATPKDSDKDGIYDRYDRCPGTPLGAPVDAYGCWEINNIYFDTNKYNIKPVYEKIIREVVKVLKLNPSLKLEISGYTDSRASKSYNLKLSKNRAEAVKKEILKYNICPCRLIIKYYGEANPAATNATAEGRALNRRVEMKIIK